MSRKRYSKKSSKTIKGFVVIAEIRFDNSESRRSDLTEEVSTSQIRLKVFYTRSGVL